MVHFFIFVVYLTKVISEFHYSKLDNKIENSTLQPISLIKKKLEMYYIYTTYKYEKDITRKVATRNEI